MSAKRILWLLNHDTLSKFELPLIRDLGFEVFTPKNVPKEILQQSGSRTYEYDQTLTIPVRDLEKLNNFNFYENSKFPFHINRIINQHFDIAIVMYNFHTIENIVNYFQGIIFTRAFGLGNDIKYFDITEQFSHNLLLKMQQIKERFYFSHCYESIAENEIGIYRDKSVFMPLGLPIDFYDIEDSWKGGLNKVLFFCSRINIFEESKRIYNKFKQDFEGFDYLVVGNQPIPVNDDRVTGFLQREELNNYYKECKVMFYHSTYPRHLHYHPLEAIIAGMPLIYMDKGLLSSLGGTRQTGRCKSISEARQKIKRILNNDTQLIEDIRKDQKEILYKFSYAYNRSEWEHNFLPLLDKNKSNEINKGKTISLFITDRQANYYLDDYKELVRIFNESIKKNNSMNKIVLNIQNGKFDMNHDFIETLKDGVSIKEYEIKKISLSELIDSLNLMFKDEILYHNEYSLPVDYLHNFIDSDYWLFLNDNLDYPIAPIKPYGIYVQDLGERFYDKISDIHISNYKKAHFLLVSSEQTKIDLIKHLGIKQEKILFIPFIHSKYQLNMQHYTFSEHTLIELDFNKKELVLNVINELYNYYRLYGKKEEIKIHFNIDSKMDNYLMDEYNKAISNFESLKKNVSLHYDCNAGEYNFLYSHAKNIVFPHHISNIYSRLSKAAHLSKRIIVNDFPFYRDMEKNLDYPFEYKKFNLQRNALIESLAYSSVTQSQKLEGEVSFKLMVDEVSKMWRNLF